MPVETIDLARTLVDVLEDKKAEDIVLLDLAGHSDFADFFIICSGTSERQIDALVEAVDERGRSAFQLKSPRVEGHPRGGWGLAGFGSPIVHVFSPQPRRRYKLEELSPEGKVV